MTSGTYSLEQLMDCVDTIAAVSGRYVYVVDAKTNDYLYISDGWGYWCGMKSEDIMNMGVEFFFKKFSPQEEQKIIIEVFRNFRKMIHELPIEERKGSVLSYEGNFLMGRRRLPVNNQCTPLIMSEKGEVELWCCSFGLSALKTFGHFYLLTGNDTFYEYSTEARKWINRGNITLTERERDIISLSTQGYTMMEIAATLCMSKETVKKSKQTLFEKLGVKNMLQAIAFIANFKMM